MGKKKVVEVRAGFEGEILFAADAAMGQLLVAFGAGKARDRRVRAAVGTAHDELLDAVAYLGHGVFLLLPFYLWPVERANPQSIETYCALYRFGYNEGMKDVEFLGDSLKVISGFPKEARQNAGRQLAKVQKGNLPDSFKPMPQIGVGVEEIRIRDESGIYRVIYTARLADAVYVLHAFQKKTMQTSKQDKAIAKQRFKQLMRGES
jgi:phage-related protein